MSGSGFLDIMELKRIPIPTRQVFEYIRSYTFDIFQHVSVIEPQHLKPQFGHKVISDYVGGNHIFRHMLAAIYFYNKPAMRAKEIYYIVSDDFLPIKPIAINLP
jgi:hypothetical protein